MKLLLISSFVMQITAVLATMILAGPVLGQELGSVVHNGVEMKVKAAVAVWRPDPDQKGLDQLKFFLLPYVPTPKEIQRILVDKWSVESHKSPDPKKWPDCSPYATYTLYWDKERGGVGDHNEAVLSVYAFNVGAKARNINFINVRPGKYVGTLKGMVKVGEKVELTAKGKDASKENTVSWDLHLSTKVLADTSK